MERLFLPSAHSSGVWAVLQGLQDVAACDGSTIPKRRSRYEVTLISQLARARVSNETPAASGIRHLLGLAITRFQCNETLTDLACGFQVQDPNDITLA